jgi:KamA family protein
MKLLQKEYKAYHIKDLYHLAPLRDRFSGDDIHSMEKVAHVIPFRVNNYVVEELIDWNNIPDDPIFRLTFPHKAMLLPRHMKRVTEALLTGSPRDERFRNTIHQIRLELNPHPNGQRKNIPVLDGEPLTGVQHKYRETVLFFPGQGQTCHAYCTFCFRWPQFTKMDKMKFGMHQTDRLVRYLKKHPEVSDLLYTGGDPMIMSANRFESYVDPILKADLPHVQNIRIGTKSLAYWPYRFVSDKDADDMLRLFERIVKSGKHLAFMAHFNHPAEMNTPVLQKAVNRIRETGAIIRTQSPLMQHINDEPLVWETMWREQVKLGMVPYYMFVARNTGARHYFEVPLIKTYRIFKKAYKHVSGLARTVRGPSMSTYYGKIQLLGVTETDRKKLFVLQFLQARNKDWNNHPFLARYSEDATWLNDLKPAFGQEEFFFERDPVGLTLN